jgi:hypothetical protein
VGRMGEPVRMLQARIQLSWPAAKRKVDDGSTVMPCKITSFSYVFSCIRRQLEGWIVSIPVSECTRCSGLGTS